MVATDGHRLALVHTAEGEDQAGFPNGVIIPESGISQIRKMASSFVGQVQVGLYKNDIVVKAGTEFLRIATIDEMRITTNDGAYIHYVMPSRASNRFIDTIGTHAP